MHKRLLYFFLTFTAYAGIALGQKTLIHQSPQVLYDNANYLMGTENYGAARSYFEQYLASNDTVYRVESEYLNAICGLKLYHLDGEKLIEDFVSENTASPLSKKAYIELGEYFFQDRNYKQAIVYLSKVDQKSISKNKKATIQYKLGYSYFATKKFSQALTQFSAVKKSNNPFKDPSHYYAGFIEYDSENYDAALKDYLAIKDNKAFSSSVPYMITSIYYKSENYKDLIGFAKPILDNNEKVQQQGQMSILLAESYYKLGNFKDAYFYFNQAHKSEKFTAQSVYHYGITAEKSGNKSKAISLLKSVAGQSNKVGALASYNLGKLYLDNENQEFAFTAFKNVAGNMYSGDLKEESKFISGKLAYELGRYSESITILSEFKESYPESAFTSKIDDILAQAFLNTRNYKPALDYIEGIENKSDLVWQAYQQATYHYGVDLYNDRKFNDAINYFEKSLEHPIVPSYIQKANLWIAEAYSIGRRYKDALPFYNAAIKISKTASPDDYWMSVYGRGYAYYNTNEYSKALTDFKGYVENVSDQKTTYGDALVRLADCYYVAKDYRMALQQFTKAIRGVVKEKDYAYYQTGVIYGLQDDYSKAMDYLNRVINVYTTSAYYDDALFEKGLLQLKKEEFQKSVTTLNKLVKEKPRSPYVAFAIERLAVANFNLGNYNKTVTLYKRFIDSYPKNPNVSDALIGLQESMNLAGREGEFDQILKDFRTKNPEIEGLERVELESLKALYNNQEYERAASGLAGYMEAYPDDVNKLEIQYLLAESLFRLNKEESALNIYRELYASGGEIRVHRIVERIADIEASMNNFNESTKYYYLLSSVAVSNNQKLRAWMGLMDGYYLLGAYDSTMKYAELLLSDGGIRNEFVVAATLKKGMALMNLGKFDNALLLFERTTNLAKDKNGAEAQYYIGVILNQQGDFTNSNEALYVIPEQYGMYVEWLDKGFLLVAENFIAVNEYFQAKATLQSIIDNSENPNTVQIASDRYEWITNEEAKELTVLPDSLNTVELDTTSKRNE